MFIFDLPFTIENTSSVAVSDFKRWFVFRLLNAAKRNLVPNPLMDVIKKDLRKQFDAADGQRPLIWPVMRKEMIMMSKLPVSRQNTALTKLR